MEPGRRIADRFTVVRELGAGGMGTVYEIRPDSDGPHLALKVLAEKFTIHRQIVERFRREAEVQAAIQHRGVVQVVELIEVDDTLGIVMEFVSAPTLADVLDEGPMPPNQVRELVGDLLSVLASCHASGIAHRDLKPENVFVLRQSGRLFCKLADFGVAKLLTPTPDEQKLTRGHTFVGTPRYASPEQVMQSAAIDGRSDLYTLGVMAWEMLTGDMPYEDIESRRKLQVAVLDDPLGPLPPGTPTDLRTLVEALTQKEREERVQSAALAMEMLGLSPAAIQPVATRTLSKPLSPSATFSSETFAFERPTAAAEPASRPTKPPPAPTMPPAPPPLEPNRPPAARPTDNIQRVRTAGLPRRLGARLIDEMLLQVLVLSCVGILIYPFVALARGIIGGYSSPGSVAASVELVNAKTGEPATPVAILVRNLADLFTYQLAIAAILWPVGWLYFVPIAGLVWLLLFGWIGPVIALIDPQGRRLADRIAGTRVVRVRE